MNREIGIEEARKTLGDIITRTIQTREPTTITRNSKPVAVLTPVYDHKSSDVTLRPFDPTTIIKYGPVPLCGWHVLIHGEIMGHIIRLPNEYVTGETAANRRRLDPRNYPGLDDYSQIVESDTVPTFEEALNVIIEP